MDAIPVSVGGKKPIHRCHGQNRTDAPSTPSQSQPTGPASNTSSKRTRRSLTPNHTLCIKHRGPSALIHHLFELGGDHTSGKIRWPGTRKTLSSKTVICRLATRNNVIAIRWTPVHLGVGGDEAAGGWAKAAAETPPTQHTAERSHPREMSFVHMTRVTTGAKSQSSRVVSEPRQTQPKIQTTQGEEASEDLNGKRIWQDATINCCQATRQRELFVKYNEQNPL